MVTTTKSKPRIVFRIDASWKIGLGHLVRSLALAEGMKDAGINSLFVLTSRSAYVTRKILKAGHNVKIIRRDGILNDAKQTKECVETFGASALIIDLRHTNNIYLNFLKKTCLLVVLVDDFGNLHPASGILINYNVGAEKYRGVRDSKVKYLLGPQYFMLRKEFQSRVGKNNAKNNLNRILITMGGSDPNNFTERILELLRHIKQASDVKVSVVVGPLYRKKKRLVNRITKANGNIRLLFSAEKMSNELSKSDLVITSGGITKYEVAALGVPAVIIPPSEKQVENFKKFEKRGSCICLEQEELKNTRKLGEIMERFESDPSFSKKMSKKGRKLVDGKGVERLIRKILSATLRTNHE